MTTCTGIRNDSCTGSVSGGRVSSSSSSEGPSYQGVFGERSTTLSPTRAETGTAWACGMPSSAAIARTSAATVRKTSSLCSTRSILLTAMTTCGTRISAATARWRRVCSSTPLRASTSSTSASAVDDPVTVLRVYCTWPGQSASTNERCGRGEVAVGDVDRDALLALGAQAVGEQREVGRGQAAVAADPLDGVELVGEHRLGVVEQAPDEGGLAVVDRTGGREAQQGAHCGVPVKYRSDGGA